MTSAIVVLYKGAEAPEYIKTKIAEICMSAAFSNIEIVTLNEADIAQQLVKPVTQTAKPEPTPIEHALVYVQQVLGGAFKDRPVLTARVFNALNDAPETELGKALEIIATSKTPRHNTDVPRDVITVIKNIYNCLKDV